MSLLQYNARLLSRASITSASYGNCRLDDRDRRRVHRRTRGDSRDPRITPAELRIQLSLIGAYLAVAGVIIWLVLAAADRGQQAWGGVVLAARLVIALPLLVRYLARRLGRPWR